MIKNSQYNDFYIALHDLIQSSTSLDNVAELVFINRYCNGLCTGVAKKFKVSAEDLMAEIILNILDNSLFGAVLSRHCAFNGRVFTYQVMNIAKLLQRKEKTYSSDDLNMEWIPSGEDLEMNVINKLSEEQLSLSLETIKKNKLHELQNLYEEITNGTIDIKRFCQSVELTLYQLMTNIKINNSYKLFNHPEYFASELTLILDKYIELFNKWFLQIDCHIRDLIIQYRDWAGLYRKLNPKLSYAAFTRKYSTPSIWDMSELELLLEVANA